MGQKLVNCVEATKESIDERIGLRSLESELKKDNPK